MYSTSHNINHRFAAREELVQENQQLFGSTPAILSCGSAEVIFTVRYHQQSGKDSNLVHRGRALANALEEDCCGSKQPHRRCDESRKCDTNSAGTEYSWTYSIRGISQCSIYENRCFIYSGLSVVALAKILDSEASDQSEQIKFRCDRYVFKLYVKMGFKRI